MGVTNMSNTTTIITFTYNVCEGSSNLSYGINIAEMVKMPQEVNLVSKLGC